MKPLTPETMHLLRESTRLYHEQLLEPEGSEALDYLTEDRGLSWATIERLQFGFVLEPAVQEHSRFAGQVVMPNIAASGDPVGLKFRYLGTPPEGKKRFDQPKGQEARLYNLQALNDASHVIYLTEGEADTASLIEVGLPAIAVPGANNWQSRKKHIVDGLQAVLMRDNDDAGQQLADDINRDVEDLIVRTCAPYKDCNEMLVKAGGEALYARAIGAG